MGEPLGAIGVPIELGMRLSAALVRKFVSCCFTYDFDRPDRASSS